MTIWPVIAFIFITLFCAYACKSGGFIDQWRDWRHGRAVDKTAEWQAFRDAFEVKK